MKVQKRRGRECAIVALTGYSNSQTKQKCLDCGMKAYVNKPIYCKELDQLIKQYMLREDST